MTSVGVVGCGNISPIYLRNLGEWPQTRVAAITDLDAAKAKARAGEFGVALAESVDALLADPQIDIVLNLTTPAGHFQVAEAALLAGKHVYNEKPLTVSLEDGRRLLALADSRGLRVGCAPDTVLGAGIQTCRALIDRGGIGRPLSAQAFMLCPGHEGWHPDPAFYYQPGGGPLFDMGPYYLAALTTLLGPVGRVAATAKSASATRTIRSEPRRGQTIPVETPTHLSLLMDFVEGATAQLTTSFDVQASTLPCIEVYGTEGSLRAPDPNGFGGPVQVWTSETREWREVPVERPYAENSRGLGVLDMALAIADGRPHRASGEAALHALEVMHAAHASSDEGRFVSVAPFRRPDAMPPEAL
jgi:predicted dehydrogenase